MAGSESLMKEVSKTWVVGGLIASAHLVSSVVCLGRASFEYGEKGVAYWWQIAFAIIGFPLIYVEKLNYRGGVPAILEFDWYPWLLVANSVLWGVVGATVWRYTYRR